MLRAGDAAEDLALVNYTRVRMKPVSPRTRKSLGRTTHTPAMVLSSLETFIFQISSTVSRGMSVVKN